MQAAAAGTARFADCPLVVGQPVTYERMCLPSCSSCDGSKIQMP